ncbi:ectoine/hydroxyectoine ABC transporter substrate-binding protein EhuB [Rhizobium sp. CCGE531]|uniref:ectoine/hydroxyectoine ABC transporter substrate-binding protein EhuB n=1 Tax=Rhizobium sp. CCGE531 TaxID=2364271 RepID=UPI000EA865F2|nr:ectoine/hydroxyectoine ABC transporter substrate-binding protein EhuB [Rhizobium sp. CCGE531]AYG66070.1 ectoine/hydroxyectoine ABC transporter substrate-binding protein EhuB [Rhizobium sp. CCGE531]
MQNTKIFRRAILIGGAVLAMASAGVPSGRADELADRVLSEGKITIGIHNQAPWGYVDKDGEVTGVGPDMIKAVLGPLGVKKVDFVAMDWDALIPSLMSKRIDVVASGMAVTEERCKQVVFSNPDLVIGDGVMVLAGNPHNIHSYDDVAKNPDLIMGGGRGSSNTENAIKAGIPKDRMIMFQDTQSSVAALLAGRIQADTESMGTAINTVNDPKLKGKLELAQPFTGLVLENGKQAANYAAIAFRPEDTKLRDLYNESLEKLKAEGAVSKIFVKNGFSEKAVAPAGITPKSLYADCK